MWHDFFSSPFALKQHEQKSSIILVSEHLKKKIPHMTHSGGCNFDTSTCVAMEQNVFCQIRFD